MKSSSTQRGTLAFFQVIGFDVVGAFAGKFLVPKRVNVELIFGYFLRLCTFIGFQINNLTHLQPVFAFQGF
jgi:hypothetical protein